MTPATLNRDPVLEVEHVLQRAVETVGPEMRGGFGFDQLCGDADPVAALAHRAFEDIADTELAPDLAHADRLPLVGKAGVAGDHKQPADAAECGNDLLDHAVGKIFLLRVAAHVLKRQHRDRRLVGQRQRCPRCEIRGQSHAFSGDLDIEHAHRPRDVLDLLLAPVVKAETELVAHLVAHDAADADAARARQRLEAGGDVDAVAIDVLPVLDDVAEIDADAKLDPPVGRLLDVAQRHLALHVDGAAHRVDDAGELDEQPVAGDPDDAAAVLLDHRVGELAAQHPQPLEGALLVLADKPRVADDVRCQDRGQSALYPRFTHQPAQPKREPPRFDAASRPTPPLSGMPPHQRL